MRTFDQVITDLMNDSLSHCNDVIRQSIQDQDKKYDKAYVTFAHEVEHYLSLGVKGIGGTPIRFIFTGYRFTLVFSYKEKYYVISLARWRYHGEVYAVPKEDVEKDLGYLYSYKYTKFGMRGMEDKNTNPEDMFKHPFKLPSHAKYNVGDFVYVNAKGYSYLRSRIFKILSVEYERQKVRYTILDLHDEDKVQNHHYTYESQLTKLTGGL